jgi:hypothetical protein
MVSSGQEGIDMSIGEEGSFRKLFCICRELAAPDDLEKTRKNLINFGNSWESKRERAICVAGPEDTVVPLRKSTLEGTVPEPFDMVRIATSVALDDSGVQVISVTGSSTDYDMLNILAILSEVRTYTRIFYSCISESFSNTYYLTLMYYDFRVSKVFLPETCSKSTPTS